MPKTSTMKVSCPYCSNKFYTTVEVDNALRRKVVLCDTEDTPGCDKFFVLEYEFRFIYDVKGIEGEDEQEASNES